MAVFDEHGKAYRIEGAIRAGHATVPNSRRKRQLMTPARRSGGTVGGLPGGRRSKRGR
jgi:hypothetical protein